MHSGPIASGSKHLAAVPRERSLVSKSFLGLLFTQFLGATNDNILRWLVIGIGKDYAGVNVSNLLALGTSVFVLPYILLAAPAGYLADRYNRKNLIANDTYYIDKDFLRGKLCIFIDDIKITGSHEYTVNRILNEYSVEADFMFLYYAELMNFDLDPKIENFFNYYAVKNVNHVAEVMNKESFQFNTRIVKYILGLDSSNFDYLTSQVKKEQMDLLLELAISNNYHLIKEYENNINTLTQTELYYGY